MKTKDFTEANRVAWDEAAPLHRGQNHDDLLSAFQASDYSCLDEIETARLLNLGTPARRDNGACGRHATTHLSSGGQISGHTDREFFIAFR